MATHKRADSSQDILNPLIYGHGNIHGITSVSANRHGTATLWTRNSTGIKTTTDTFTPFVVIGDQKLLDGLDGCRIRELSGDLEYRWFVEIQKFELFKNRLLSSYNKINSDASEPVDAIVGLKDVYSPNFTEQYLIQSGNTYYKGMKFNDVVRMQIDIETTGLLQDSQAKIFAIAIKCSSGREEVLHGEDECILLHKLNRVVQEEDPDIIENHNIFSFDLPFLYKRYLRNQVPFNLLARRNRDKYQHEDNLKLGERSEAFDRWNLDGREILDTLQSVRRYDATARELGDQYGLKHVAKCFGFARDDSAYIDGDKIYSTYKSDMSTFLKYALADVREVDEISKLLHQDKFYLAQMVPMRIQKIATAGTSKMIEYPIVRMYLEKNHSLPRPAERVKYSGGLVELEKVGLFHNAIKIDVASMYPSIILNNNIGPKKDPLNIFVPLLSTLKDLRIEYKRKSKTDKAFKPLQSALKIVINGSYGYLGTEFGLFNNPQGAADTTSTGRNILTKMLGSIKKNGGDPIEADTDGIICEYPSDKMSPQEFSKLIQNDIAEFKGIEVESESDEPWSSIYVYAKKSYVVFHHDKLKITGAALRSKSIAPIFKDLIQRALLNIINRDIAGFLEVTKDTHRVIASGKCDINNLLCKMTLQKSIAEYQKTKKNPQPQYEVLIKAGMLGARAGFASEFYMSKTGFKHVSQFSNDYSVNHYLDAFKKKLRMFRHAFDRNLFGHILDFDFDRVDLTTPFTNYEVALLSGDIPESPLSHYQRREILELIDTNFNVLNEDDLMIDCSFSNLTVAEDRDHVLVTFKVFDDDSKDCGYADSEHEEVLLGRGYQEYIFKVKVRYGVDYERLIAQDLDNGIGGLDKKFYNDLSQQISERLKISLQPIPELDELDYP